MLSKHESRDQKCLQRLSSLHDKWHMTASPKTQLPPKLTVESLEGESHLYFLHEMKEIDKKMQSLDE